VERPGNVFVDFNYSTVILSSKTKNIAMSEGLLGPGLL
jgi:hypothetical protein